MRGFRGVRLRGAPVPRRALRWATIAREIVLDTASKYHEWAKVIWKLMIKSPGLRATQDTALRGPAGGSVITETNDAMWEVMETRMDASGIKTVWYIIMYYTAAALRIPYQALLFDYSDSDYASSRQGDKPLNQYIMYHQQILRREFDVFFQFMLGEAVARNLLSEEVEVLSITETALEGILSDIKTILMKESAPEVRMPLLLEILESVAEKKKVKTLSLKVSQIFPETAGETLLNKARAIELFDRAGIASKQTLSELAGFNWITEIARILAHADFTAELGRRAMLRDKDEDGNDLMPDNRERGAGADHPRPDEGEEGGTEKTGAQDTGDM